MDEPRIVELESHPTVAVRLAIPFRELDLSAVFARELPRLAGHLVSHHEAGRHGEDDPRCIRLGTIAH